MNKRLRCSPKSEEGWRYKRILSFFMVLVFSVLALIVPVLAETPQYFKDLLLTDGMKSADFAMIVKDTASGEIIIDHNIDDNIVPASVLKIVTTATALEILGEDYRFSTFLQYDGEIKDNVLYGNLYVKGTGDPTLGSEHFDSGVKFMDEWVEAIQKLGIKKITGSVISDESIFDNEGISPKWLKEDMGNAYAAGSYGINIFDNKYKLNIRTGAVGTSPAIQSVAPDMPYNFNNNMNVSTGLTGASIFGIPFSNERFLGGQLSANSSRVLEGDISDPPLYLASFLTNKLRASGVAVEGSPSCSRIQVQSGKPLSQKRHDIITTYSPALSEIVKVTNYQSHNLFADALLKTIGTLYSKPDEAISSFEKGVKVLKDYWSEKGIDSSVINIYDGSGLSAIDTVNAGFVCEILDYMVSKSSMSKTFVNSLPKAGIDGTVKNFLSGTYLQGKAMIKGGSMDRVRSYAGYVALNNKTYIICIFANNYSCTDYEMAKAIEKIFLNIFSE